MTLSIVWRDVKNPPEPMLVMDAEMGYEKLNLVTQNLGFMLMAVGISEITEENWEKIYKRIYAWEHVNGPLRVSQEGPIYTTPQEVNNHVGLWVNVKNIAESTFKTQLINNLYDDADLQVQNL